MSPQLQELVHSRLHLLHNPTLPVWLGRQPQPYLDVLLHGSLDRVVCCTNRSLYPLGQSLGCRDECRRRWRLHCGNNHMAQLCISVSWRSLGPKLHQEHGRAVPYAFRKRCCHSGRSCWSNICIALYQGKDDRGRSGGWMGKDQGYWQSSQSVGRSLQGKKIMKAIYIKRSTSSILNFLGAWGSLKSHLHYSALIRAN